MDHGGGGGKSFRNSSSSRSHPYRKETGRSGPPADERVENKLYVGNLDHRVTEYHVLKMFSPFGKIKREEYLWHTHGPKRGEPRGYAFIEYSTREEAELARARMNGRPAYGRPLVVRFVDEKVVTYNTDAPVWTRDAATSAPKVETQATVQNNISKSAKIAAIQSKLRAMEQEDEVMKAQGRPPPSLAPGTSTIGPGMTSARVLGGGSEDGRGGGGPWNPPPPFRGVSEGGMAGGGRGDGAYGRGPHSRTLLPNGNRWGQGWG